MLDPQRRMAHLGADRLGTKTLVVPKALTVSWFNEVSRKGCSRLQTIVELLRFLGLTRRMHDESIGLTAQMAYYRSCCFFVAG